MGFKTVALGRGKEKEELARKLGAHHYIDSGTADAAAALQKARWRSRDSGDGTERAGDFRNGRWIIAEREAGHGRCA